MSLLTYVDSSELASTFLTCSTCFWLNVLSVIQLLKTLKLKKISLFKITIIVHNCYQACALMQASEKQEAQLSQRDRAIMLSVEIW